MSIFYLIVLLTSVVFSLIYALKWNKRYNVFFTILFCIIPIACFGYMQMELATSVESYTLGTKLSYVGGCFCMLAINLNIMELCHIQVKRIWKQVLFAGSLLTYLSTLTIGISTFYYRSITITFPDQAEKVVTKVYGPGHTIFLIWTALCFGIAGILLVLAYRKREQVSRTTVTLILFLMVTSAVLFVLPKLHLIGFDPMPISYVIAQLVFLLIADRLVMYDLDSSVIDVSVKRGQIGVVSFDKNLRYLGSNDVAKEFFPELKTLQVDRYVTEEEAKIAGHFLLWIKEVIICADVVEKYYRQDQRIYKIQGDEIMDGKRVRGYSFMISDDSQEQEKKRLLADFNDVLQTEVEQKTKHIIEMYNRIVLGMVDVVESRDVNTGGHVRRASHGVRILIEEMKRDPSLNLSEKFCSDVIKAAPLHDLGKIAVDDAVLRKKGKFTDEEYAMMKIHSARGAELIHNLLSETEDPEFARIAENVAHYHHERPDGKGYPEGLTLEKIPLEARIMAIADVYDALVSKRCYKDRMSFEEADRIMLDGMGKQFDKALEPYYIAARDKLELYYLQCFAEDDDTRGLN